MTFMVRTFNADYQALAFAGIAEDHGATVVSITYGPLRAPSRDDTAIQREAREYAVSWYVWVRTNGVDTDELDQALEGKMGG